MRDAEPWHKPSRSQLALWKSLGRTQIRHEEGLFLAEGLKVVSELLRSNYQHHALLIMEEKKEHLHTFLGTVPDNTAWYSLTSAQWNKLSQDKNPEGIMAVVGIPPPLDTSTLPRTGHILLAYCINDPNNLGALVRTAHWFGFGALLISSDSVDFTNGKVVRTSMGSLFHIPILAGLNFTAMIPKLKGHFIVAASHTEGGVIPHPCSHPTALLLGSESHGLPHNLTELADEMWSIPGAGKADSLSLPQAAAIMMYEAVKKTAG